ncbi:hypothetical protein AAE478_006948 [Parahypoxylon ruwenzoriense]
MDLSKIPDYHGDTEIGLNGWLIGFSTIFYGLRIFVRVYMTKSPGLDDGIATLAYILLVVQSSMDINAVSFGSGAHLSYVPDDLVSKFFESLGIQTLIYFWAVAMTHRVHAVVGVAVDVILLILPIWVICTKMMWSRKTLQIILVLSVGVFAAATGIIRLAMMTAEDFFVDITYEMATLGIWTNLEGHVGLWCGCFPALQPILRMPNKIKVVSTMNSNGNITRHTRDIPSSRIGTATRKEFEGDGSSTEEIDSESERAIVLLEMGKDDAAKKDRETSPK